MKKRWEFVGVHVHGEQSAAADPGFWGEGAQPLPPGFYSTYACYIQFCQHRGDVKLNETDMVSLSH